jgi:hypothetical protein
VQALQEREDAKLDVLGKVGEGNGTTACLFSVGIHHFLRWTWKRFSEVVEDYIEKMEIAGQT